MVSFCGHSAAQTRAEAPAEPRFEVVSFKHVGNIHKGSVDTDLGNGLHKVTWRDERLPKYTGVRLSGEARLRYILRFAYSSVVNPYYSESPDWMDEEFYRIEAVAPAGTTTDAARAMLRTALVERLGLQCHLADREKHIFALLRASGDLKLVPSTEDEPNPGFHQVGVFKSKSASLANLATFLSMLTGTQVFDKTGMTGRYKFDEDWSHQVTGTWGADPNIAFAVVKRLGLKLEPGKQTQKTLVVDRANKEPAPN